MVHSSYVGAGSVRRVGGGVEGRDGAPFWVYMESLNWSIDSDWAIPFFNRTPLLLQICPGGVGGWAGDCQCLYIGTMSDQEKE